jgi:oligopeptide/dipeptide ABC transporter ATP-binding protein
VLLIADEATTALDVTIQAEILELLRDLKRSYDLALLLITHDLGVVAQTADRVAVMYAGRIAEEAPVRELFTAPRHPYTQALLASMPGGPAGSRLRPIEGAVPPPDAIRAGCVFAPRCPARLERCGRDRPPEITVAPGHHAHCWLLADDAPGGPGDRPIP